jgi:hypothetical protein
LDFCAVKAKRTGLISSLNEIELNGSKRTFDLIPRILLQCGRGRSETLEKAMVGEVRSNEAWTFNSLEKSDTRIVNRQVRPNNCHLILEADSNALTNSKREKARAVARDQSAFKCSVY